MDTIRGLEALGLYYAPIKTENLVYAKPLLVDV